MRDGRYISTHFIVHIVKDNRYICNRAIGEPKRAIPFRTSYNCQHLCKRCFRIIMKKVAEE